MYFVFAAGEKRFEAKCFCDLHGRSHIHDFRKALFQSANGRLREAGNGGRRRWLQYRSAFLRRVATAPNGYCCVQLVEIGGSRRLSFVTDPQAWSALNIEMRGVKTWRPLMHNAMAATIAALGGRLEYIEIDKFHVDQHVFEAKLHIKQYVVMFMYCTGSVAYCCYKQISTSCAYAQHLSSWRSSFNWCS